MNFFKIENLFKLGKRSLINDIKRNISYKPIETENKITVGHKLTQVLEKNRQKAIQNESASNKFKINPSSSRVLISCSTKAKNHYSGQIYPKFSEQHNLASSSWYNRISSGKYFTINPSGAHPSLLLNNQNEFIEFNNLNLDPNLITLLKQNLKINKPTNIQSLTIDAFRNRESHLLINAETGGGKTLAYLLPLIEKCFQTKQFIQDSNLKRGSNQPLAIVLLPTRELVYQVKSVFDKLIQTINESNDYLNSIKSLRVVCDTSTSPADSDQMDILITQPNQLKRRLEQNKSHYESIYLKNVILDEADTLLDDSFNETVIDCLTKLNLHLDLKDKLLSCQLAFVSATIPRDLKNILKNIIDTDTELKHLTTNRTNRLLLVTPQKFLRLSTTKRNEHLIELLKKELENKSRKRVCMIFSHRTSTATFVSKFLRENNIECELLTKETPNRDAIVERFFKKEIQILVCTDIASRGWDTTHVSHVINFEMPVFIADYLHRIGRVGRLGSVDGGIVTNYVTRAYEIDLVKNIEKSIRLNQDLHNINANAARFYKYLNFNKQKI